MPSNTDKYCPNPELSLYTETAEGMWLCIGFKVTVVVMYLAANLDRWLPEALNTDVRIPYLVFGFSTKGGAAVFDLTLAVWGVFPVVCIYHFNTATRMRDNGT